MLKWCNVPVFGFYFNACWYICPCYHDNCKQCFWVLIFHFIHISGSIGDDDAYKQSYPKARCSQNVLSLYWILVLRFSCYHGNSASKDARDGCCESCWSSLSNTIFRRVSLSIRLGIGFGLVSRRRPDCKHLGRNQDWGEFIARWFSLSMALGLGLRRGCDRRSKHKDNSGGAGGGSCWIRW